MRFGGGGLRRTAMSAASEDAGPAPHQKAAIPDRSERADRRKIILAGNVADAEQHGGAERAAESQAAAGRRSARRQVGQRKRRIADDMSMASEPRARPAAAQREGDGEGAVEMMPSPRAMRWLSPRRGPASRNG